MRLLNVQTLAFEEFIGEVGNGIPPYAILSHTWGPEEVTFKDHTEQQDESCEKKGYDKIRGCCRLAESEGFQYVWIDTCCIDKSSSAELSEAINSMFQWYRDAAICYAYLSDVDSLDDLTVLSDGDEKSESSSVFARSRWFTRGWTLQELLAPAEVVFLAADWSEIGTKRSLGAEVSRITRISEKVLLECRWDEYSVAQKMSWAAGRQTTRLEDAAYCLMGLFDVNMPLLYGEGRKAFSRLQQAIMQRSEDQSIFAWSYPDDKHSHILMSGIMAPSPEYFKDASQIETLNRSDDYESPFEVVNQLVRLRLRLLDEVEGIKLQTYASKPLLHDVIEVQQINGGPQVLAQDTGIATIPDALPVIDSAGGIPRLGGVALEDELTEINVDGISSSGSMDRDLQKDSSDGNEHENTGEFETLIPINKPMWRWYIYEKVVIAPLRCRIGQNQLGILLSKGRAYSLGGKMNLRLHYPSLVMINSMTANMAAAKVQTMYVAVSMTRTPFRTPIQEQSFVRLCWPEIRFHSLKAAGYRPVSESGAAWTLDSEKSLFKSLHSEVVGEPGTTDYGHEPIVLFHHQSGKDSTYPTLFFRLTVTNRDLTATRRKESLVTCVLGIYNPTTAGSTASMNEDFRIYSTNLLQKRGIEVASGYQGHSVAVRLRQGHGVFFVNVSFQKACRGALQAPQDIPDASEANWLEAKLKSARASFRED
ncbi:hypothetical protein J7T55_006589 [Diaporthe amygdali]|uniref:uncharacterized protein n=1 Tax=Phomopsis amygdali TaxID=1214568 RepID=UPI0022FDDF85|nr:uncharacterized protein J7T55_006589 [Diaporthe amygdali]KAJ0125244.1 hypothetical protein J7T55_006589 [Diaporthe amygdali]